MALAIRILRALPMLILAPFLMAISAAALAATDLVWKISGRRTARPRSKADNRSASVVIPNWNGRDLLERYLPSVIEALSGNPASEVIVVDNGSSDGSADSVRQAFPSVRVLALPENLGFGG